MIRPLLVTLGAVAVFVGCAFFVNPDEMSQVLSVAVFVAAAWGLVRWGAAASRAYLRGAKTVEQQGVLGIVLLLFAIIAQRAYAFWFLALGRPDAWLALDVSPAITYISLIALILFITATRFAGERPTPLGGIAAASIAFMAVMASSLGPWLSKLVFAALHTLIRAW